MVYGRPPPMITKYMPGSSKVDQVDKKLLDRDKIIQFLRDNLVVSQTRMKQQADKHRSEREFTMGNWVFLRLQPYKQTSIKV